MPREKILKIKARRKMIRKIMYFCKKILKNKLRDMVIYFFVFPIEKKNSIKNKKI